jgi:hypothetical protein
MQQSKVPPFPFESELSDTDKAIIAGAAWDQSNGSAEAFQQLILEHLSGVHNLLPQAPVDPGPPGSSGLPLSGAEITRLAELRAQTDPPLSLEEVAERDALAARE